MDIRDLIPYTIITFFISLFFTGISLALCFCSIDFISEYGITSLFFYIILDLFYWFFYFISVLDFKLNYTLQDILSIIDADSMCVVYITATILTFLINAIINLISKNVSVFTYISIYTILFVIILIYLKLQYMWDKKEY